MTINRIDEGALECGTPDGLRLGFPTGISTRRFSSADTVSIRNSEGIVIDASGETTSWPIEKFIEHEGDMVAVGPWLENSRPFDEVPVDLKMIIRLLPAVRAIRAAGYPLNGLYSRAVRWLPDGGILIYPPKLASWVRELNPDNESVQAWEKWVHPDHQGEAAWSFTLGVLAWRSLTGVDPFADETGEARRERIRRGALPPLEALTPGVDEGAAALIRKSLIESENKIPSLEEWEGLIDLWRRKGIVSDLSGTEIEERKAQAARKAGTIERELKARRWFRKSGWKLFTIIIVTAALLLFVSSPIRKALETPVTAGMTPLQVAETYYGAIDAMDSAIMNDCLARKTGKDDIRLIDTVFVTTKVRQGYEGLGDPPRASDWIRDGKPELLAGVWPWGVTDLELKELTNSRIEARYLLWTPPGGGTEGETTAWSISRTDILSFTEGRKSWEINAIDRITED